MTRFYTFFANRSDKDVNFFYIPYCFFSFKIKPNDILPNNLYDDITPL